MPEKSSWLRAASDVVHALANESKSDSDERHREREETDRDRDNKKSDAVSDQSQ